MVPPPIHTLQNFLCLVTQGAPLPIAELSRALDRLLMAYHEAASGCGVPEESRAENREPPGSNYAELYASLGARFPDLGYYATADPSLAIDADPVTGDAVDDLADIVRDVREICWRFENLGASDALWHLRFLFEVHWGWHLRHLCLYLHAKQFA